MASELNIRLSRWKSEGWQIERRSNSFMLTHPKASDPVFCALTNSCYRALENVEAAMRRLLRTPDSKPSQSVVSTPAPKKINKSSVPVTTAPKHRKYFIPTRVEQVQEIDNSPQISVYAQLEQPLINEVWRWQYLRMRFENRDISLIHAIRTRFIRDDAFLCKVLENFYIRGREETAKLRPILRQRGMISKPKTKPLEAHTTNQNIKVVSVPQINQETPVRALNSSYRRGTKRNSFTRYPEPAQPQYLMAAE